MSKDMTPVRSETLGEITVVTLDRRTVKNAVDRDTAEALAEAFLAFERDETQKVAVFHGANDTFCAGADLRAVMEGSSGGNRVSEPKVGAAFDPLTAEGPMGPSRMVLSKPVIGAISGYAVAGGMELALWCDLRLIDQTTVFGIFCRRWGVPLVDGGTVRLPRLIGHSRAMDLILTGRPVEADEALAIGLANRIVATGEVLEAAVEMAERIAKFPQTCLRNDRMSAYEQWGLPYDQAMHREYELGMASLSSPEMREHVAGFVSGKGRGGRFDGK